MHKDLSEIGRDEAEEAAVNLVNYLRREGESLALAREAMINAFDGQAAASAK